MLQVKCKTDECSIYIQTTSQDNNISMQTQNFAENIASSSSSSSPFLSFYFFKIQLIHIMVRGRNLFNPRGSRTIKGNREKERGSRHSDSWYPPRRSGALCVLEA